MAARKSFVYMKNFPVVTANVYEGTLTRYTSAVTPTGGIAEGAAVYSAPVVKGDLLKLKDGTDKGVILVEKIAADGENVVGMAVSDPFGVDNTTVSGQTPVLALQRKVDVALFGIGIIELTVSATGAVAAGDLIGMDGDEVNEVEVQHDYSAGAVVSGDQGGIIALTYAAAGEKVALLVGASCFVGN